MLYGVCHADAIEDVWTGEAAAGTLANLGQIGELDSIVGEHDLNPVRHGGDKGLQEGARGLRIGLVDELGDRELGWAVDRDKR